jgi:ribosomal protein L35
MSGMHRRLPTVPIVVVDPSTRIDPESTSSPDPLPLLRAGRTLLVARKRWRGLQTWTLLRTEEFSRHGTDLWSLKNKRLVRRPYSLVLLSQVSS